MTVAGIENLTGLQHGEDGSQHHAGNGNDSAFLIAALHNAFILCPEVGAFLGSLDGGVSGFDQSGFEIDPCARNPDGLLLSGGFIAARRQTRPMAQALRRTEFGHIGADLRDDRNGKAAVNARDCAKKGNDCFILSDKPIDDIVNLRNSSVKITEVFKNDANALFLFSGHIEAFDGLNYI